jgi:hypothetical protein
MARQYLHAELLLGRKVRDSTGASAGRIEEFIARRRGDECVVEQYVLGREGLRERLSVAGLSMTFLGFLGAYGHKGARHVPWDQVDLSDPKRPQLKCTLAELDAMQPQQS